jgi:hypothetical protein
LTLTLYQRAEYSLPSQQLVYHGREDGILNDPGIVEGMLVEPPPDVEEARTAGGDLKVFEGVRRRGGGRRSISGGSRHSSLPLLFDSFS